MDSKYIICLIPQQADDDDHAKELNRSEQKATFRRIGMTKLSRWGDKLTYAHILSPHELMSGDEILAFRSPEST
jgi:hypothetical protein